MKSIPPGLLTAGAEQRSIKDIRNDAVRNPTSRQIEAKSSYIEVVDGLLVGCGVYRNKN